MLCRSEGGGAVTGSIVNQLSVVMLHERDQMQESARAVNLLIYGRNRARIMHDVNSQHR